jgi:hypothetical protein
VAAAKQLRALLPRRSVLAVGECGYIPYYSPDLRIFADFGLMEPEIARMPGLHFNKLNSAYFLKRRPDFYLMMVRESATNTAIVPTHPDGATLLASAAFRERYEAWRSYPGFMLYRRGP